MQIKQDPVTGLYCREDGAILLPPSGVKFKKFRWTFGWNGGDTYRCVGYKGIFYRIHPMVCRAFRGLPPADKPFVDHINRRKDDNRAVNLHWVSTKENNDNTARVDKSVAKYGVRFCDDRAGYNAARIADKKAQGLHYIKCSDGKYRWIPRTCP